MGGGRTRGSRARGAAVGQLGRRDEVGHGDAAEVVHEDIARDDTHAVGNSQRLKGSGGSRFGGMLVRAGAGKHLL